MADEIWVEQEAVRLLVAHQIARTWSFRFDRATTRLGQCDHRTHTISVSRYLTERATTTEVTQVLLHEIAHALAGAGAAHGPKWRSIAQQIGYVGGRTHTVEPAHERAKWVGACPSGHEIVRFRRPGKPVSCAKCDRRFNTSYLISWRAKV